MSYFPELEDRKILLVSHNLTLTGAPLLLAETGVRMAESGAEVGLATLGAREEGFPFSGPDGLQFIEIEASFEYANAADVIIANTAVAKTWVNTLLDRFPEIARKIIWWIHEVDMEAYGEGMENLANVGAAIFDSEYSRRLWEETGLLPPLAVTIHPGVSEKLYHEARQLSEAKSRHAAENGPSETAPSERAETRARLGVGTQDFLLVNIAQYCALKGQDLLVEAVGRLLELSPELPLKLVLVGFADEAERTAFLARLTSSQLRAVSSERVVSRVTDLPPYYVAADAFVLNTQLPGETFGLVCIEAMAFGLPVLATGTGGTREIVVHNETGLFHGPGKEAEEKLIANIRLLMGNAHLTKRLGTSGLKRVETLFRVDRFYREYSNVIREVMTNQN